VPAPGIGSAEAKLFAEEHGGSLTGLHGDKSTT